MIRELLRRALRRSVPVRQRSAPSSPPPIVLLVSIQKCGTHLVDRLLTSAGLTRGTPAPQFSQNLCLSDFATVKAGQFIVSHFAPADDVQMALENGSRPVKIIFNFRDPRDVLVSWFHWLHPKNPRPMHDHMRYMQRVYERLSDDELMDIFIQNDKFRAAEYNPFEQFRLSRVLLFHPRVHNVRFEDLVGPNGGGNAQRQLETVEGVLTHLGLSHQNPRAIADRLFSANSPTFRSGQIGGYRNFLTAAQLSTLESLHGDILRQYGYGDAM